MSKTSSWAIGWLIAASCFSASTSAQQQALKGIAPYPEPEKGLRRQVIALPERKNENLYKVELMIGQILEVDCNHHLLSGSLQSKTVDGWGYPYYIFETGNAAGSDVTHISTMMACPGDKKQRTFVKANLGANSLLNYNSKLPVVVYTPAGVEVKYRVWKAEDKVVSAEIK